ncbi:MAG: hypothetical protein K2Q18_12145 [Bdellovibrionales bacterium]|nr:hypothetical protein [Bdellovibrionales bacterium]
MKFLVKIEEAIDHFILNLLEKTKNAVPSFVYTLIEKLKHAPHALKEKISHYIPLIKDFIGSHLSVIKQQTTMIRGHMVGVLIFLKSEDFKKSNKLTLLFTPFRKFKEDPVKGMSVLAVAGIFSFASFFIYQSTQKIIVGTKALRAPASVKVLEEPILEFRKLKYEILEKEVFLDVTLIATSLEERDKLVPIEHEIEEHLLGMHIKATQLPLSNEDLIQIKADIIALVTGARIKDVEIKQVLEGRPKYYLQIEKLASIKDLNLQLFLEDTRRNRQVWIDFTALTSNRNIVLFLKDHEVEVRDYMNMNVEPVIPQLPIEEEGRQIIKDKIRDELNQFLKDNQIEGKILEVYVDYIMVS